MIKLRHKKGQVSMELVLLMLVVVIGAAIVATEMSKVKFNGNNTVDNVRYTTSVAFANDIFLIIRNTTLTPITIM